MKSKNFLIIAAIALAIFTGCTQTADVHIDSITITTALRTEPTVIITTAHTTAESGEYPAALSPEAARKIREDYAAYRADDWHEPTADDVRIERYWGTYSAGEVVVICTDQYCATCDIKEVTVGEYTFVLSSGSYEIYLHRDGGFVDIVTAYEEELLTDEELEKNFLAQIPENP